MLTIDPKNTPTPDMHQFLLGAVAPRPIALASTIDEEGNPNLAPFSFYNAYSSNPPTIVFSANRRVANNTTKDTLHNVQSTGEVVINAVSYNIVRQMTLTSIEYPTSVNEFEKAGFTPLPSDLVKPFRVKESPVNMECKVKDIITLGESGGAGHLIICEVVRMHIDENILDERGRIDPHKIDLMARMGRAFYARASGEAVHTILQPVNKIAIGIDQLPPSILHSDVLTANNLGQLAGAETLPPKEEILQLKSSDPQIKALLDSGKCNASALHGIARELLKKNERDYALRVAMLGEWI